MLMVPARPPAGADAPAALIGPSAPSPAAAAVAPAPWMNRRRVTRRSSRSSVCSLIVCPPLSGVPCAFGGRRGPSVPCVVEGCAHPRHIDGCRVERGLGHGALGGEVEPFFGHADLSEARRCFDVRRELEQRSGSGFGAD